MPLPGGPADKLGNRYELWWTVSQFVRMLHGEIESLRIEDPGVDKAEFVIFHSEYKEFHQAKRSNKDSKWSIKSLGGSGIKILQAIYEQLSGNDDHFVFVSSSDASEIRELIDRAKYAESSEEFESKFLGAIVQKENLERLRKYWRYPDVSVTYNLLRRITITTIDEQSLKEKISYGLHALFLCDFELISDVVRSIAEDSIHKTITRESLIGLLENRGFKLRKLTDVKSAGILIKKVTDDYLKTVRRKLIRKTIIPREASKTLIEKTIKDVSSNDLVVTGKAGTGKTGCMIEFVETLHSLEVPVLAFRLDRLAPISTTVKLGEQLELEESPALVLAAVAQKKNTDAVLIVDQLDAISTISGRISGFFDVVEALFLEARELRLRVRLHVVVVCREFDWENDDQLRKLLSDKHLRVDVSNLSPDDVRNVLESENFQIKLFHERQLELLRLPQNLALFLDAGFSAKDAPKFNTEKELFDRYWTEKQRAVKARTTSVQEQWMGVITILCKEMTNAQQLSVVREKLDGIDGDYLDQMASEGVITSDRKRYGFGHESFFDYCFARMFVVKSETLVEFLVKSEQHLFRRAQVRQVLTYIRDLDRNRYYSEIKELLSDSRIRTHLKDLVVALLFSVSDPDDREYALIEPWLKLRIETVTSERENEEKFSAVVWNYFSSSKTFFNHVDRRGFISSWLASGNDNVVDMTANYLRIHQKHFGDRVAELLEPYIGQEGAWKIRLKNIMEWGRFENSRRLFDLFLKLIDDGTLDGARRTNFSDGGFWSLLYKIEKVRPEWLSEVIAHKLRRGLKLFVEQNTEVHDVFGHAESAGRYFHAVAKACPEIFVDNVLSVVLEIVDATVERESKLPQNDLFFPVIFDREYESVRSACLHALVSAFDEIVRLKSEKVPDIIKKLCSYKGRTSNFLLLNFLIVGKDDFSDFAAELICKETWRFKCGYSDSGYWVSRQLVTAIFSLCSYENKRKLEEAILSYSPSYERTKDGYKFSGNAKFELLSAIPSELRTANIQARYEELERKFLAPSRAPVGVRGGFVVSPIAKQTAEKMTDAQWLNAIKKYSDNHKHSFDDHMTGGAYELAGVLEDVTRNDPKRFAQLSLLFPTGTNPAYINSVLYGLRGKDVSSDLKINICRKAYNESRKSSAQAIIGLLSSLKEILPNDAIEMLQWFAMQAPDPEKELWNSDETDEKPCFGGDILSHGINTVRGNAAEAIGHLIQKDPLYISYFKSTLLKMVEDRSIAVRSCVGYTVLAVAQHDIDFAFELFEKLVQTDDRLMTTRYIMHFMSWAINKHFGKMRIFLERMIRSEYEEVNESGSQLAALSILYGHEAMDLITEAMKGNSAHRLGLAKVASANIGQENYKAWCEEYLLKFFNDEEDKVRGQAALCFSKLENSPLENYEKLLVAFCDSKAYETSAFSILHMLKDSLYRLPGVMYLVCEKFIIRFMDEAKDIRTSKAADIRIVSELIFRIYHQHQNDEWASRCLNLIDSLCLEGAYDVHEGLDKFER